MRRIMLSLATLCVALFLLAGQGLAQGEPEFRMGFKALAEKIPHLVGEPLENEHYQANGDSLQRTTTGLMVWRKADNVAAFTNGYRSWVTGPSGIQERGNDERFDWEAAEPTASPTATPTPSPAAPTGASATPTPASTPTPAVQPTIKASKTTVINGEDLEANSVWVLGEIRNDGSVPAYTILVTARLLSDSGEVVGSGTQSFPYLGPGDTVGYGVRIQKPSAYARAEVSVSATGSSFAHYEKLSVAGTPMQKSTTSYGGDDFEWSSSVTNTSGKQLSACAVYIWFMDEFDNVLWADIAFPAPNLAPGASAEFQVRTTRTKYNPMVGGINQVKAFAIGME